MAKFVQILFVAFLAIALCSAEAPRSRYARVQAKRTRFLARQEVAAEPDVVTPYPSADELKPEVPFDEAAASTPEEEQIPNQPDEVYGPPEQDVPVATDDVAPVEGEVEAEAPVAEEEAVVPVAEEEVPARLTARRAGLRKSAVRPAKLLRYQLLFNRTYQSTYTNMAKFMQILFVAFLAIALVSAEAPRRRFQGRRRFLARQEVAEEAVTPYPSADELKPEVPFNEAEAPEEQTPNQPDEVYGPPEQDLPAETDDIVPVEEEEEAVAAEEAAAEEEAVESARFTARRAGARRVAARPAKLRKAAPARLQRQFVRQPVFFYVAQ
ncbi:uncharacterized protein LOC133326114 [Musca vetustissima]|uniref:uncharacterized protein LOC133326114 n=1 Tax=Musca vetustissima TaxID=27455 RepID=UPI002AB769BB|nr:uncharacterized protein LOC133326114 [Musca vetustissima]